MKICDRCVNLKEPKNSFVHVTLTVGIGCTVEDTESGQSRMSRDVASQEIDLCENCRKLITSHINSAIYNFKNP